MLLLTLVCDVNDETIIEELSSIKHYFQNKGVNVGISESIVDTAHFIKLFCDSEAYSDKFINTFNILIGNILYDAVIDEFCRHDIQKFLSDTYFFLKYDEISELKKICIDALKSEGPILDENMIYCINRKNSAIKKIIKCIEDNEEINIKGFITFRTKELREDIEDIIDKVVEKYMVEKEYDEFIKLLKYFVEIQESKIDEVNIYISNDSSYTVRDKDNIDITERLFSELSEARFTGTVSMDDMLISGLITNSPERITIHCVENCSNKELIDTIKSVFINRVSFCSTCDQCKEIKIGVKV